MANPDLAIPPRRYWWVNQNKTFAQEVGGGYMWSPKRTKGDRRMNAYENMRAIAVGDIIFSFHKSTFAAVGIATSTGYDCIVPQEFKAAALNWDSQGWRVDVTWMKLASRIRPRDHMPLLRPLLPPRYSPLLPDGRGMMHYLFELPPALAETIAGLVGPPATELIHASRGEVIKDIKTESPVAAPVKEWEDRLQQAIEANKKIPLTEKRALINARVGQGRFKESVRAHESFCRVTGVRNGLHLIGSHIKPWRHGTNEERLDGENGLLLTPSIDHLFDKGLISFKNNGTLLISDSSDRDSLAKMGIRDESSAVLKAFSNGQQKYLEYHRDVIFAQRGV